MYTIILSALIYLGAFIYPDYLYAGIFIWMLPIMDKDYEFKAGYTWGLIFFGGHLLWLGCANIIVYIATVSYFSIISEFWLWLKQLLEYRWVRKIKNHNGKCVALCCTWVISTVTFICLTCYCSLAILDCFEGYTLANPLLPLVSWIWYLRPICYFGVFSYWIIIVLVNLALAKLIKKFDGMTLIFLIVLIGFPALFQPPHHKINIEKKDFFYIQPTWNNNAYLTSSEKFYAISRTIDVISTHCADVQYIVLPEGSFGHDLMAWEDQLDVWTSLLSPTTSIFIGAHRKNGNAMYNSLYQIKDGIIINWYDKQHLVCCTERKPWITQFLPMFEKLFGHEYFTYPHHNQSKIIMEGFVPMICSELFCQEKRPSIKDRPILLVCHDGWFSMRYARDLACRCAKLYSLRYQVPIVYIGSYEMQIIM